MAVFCLGSFGSMQLSSIKFAANTNILRAHDSGRASFLLHTCWRGHFPPWSFFLGLPDHFTSVGVYCYGNLRKSILPLSLTIACLSLVMDKRCGVDAAANDGSCIGRCGRNKLFLYSLEACDIILLLGTKTQLVSPCFCHTEVPSHWLNPCICLPHFLCVAYHDPAVSCRACNISKLDERRRASAPDCQNVGFVWTCSFWELRNGMTKRFWMTVPSCRDCSSETWGLGDRTQLICCAEALCMRLDCLSRWRDAHFSEKIQMMWRNFCSGLF